MDDNSGLLQFFRGFGSRVDGGIIDRLGFGVPYFNTFFLNGTLMK